MFFAIKEVKGSPYLYRLTSFRSSKKHPTNSAEYVGPVEKVENTIKRWKRNNK